MDHQDAQLRRRLIRLAHANPHLRRALLPLLRTSGDNPLEFLLDYKSDPREDAELELKREIGHAAYQIQNARDLFHRPWTLQRSGRGESASAEIVPGSVVNKSIEAGIDPGRIPVRAYWKSRSTPQGRVYVDAGIVFADGRTVRTLKRNETLDTNWRLHERINRSLEALAAKSR